MMSFFETNTLRSYCTCDKNKINTIKDKIETFLDYKKKKKNQQL